MKIRYEDFLKLYEGESVVISLADVENIIKAVFSDMKVASVKTLYERDEETQELKLIVSINNLFYDKTDILHTKFVFMVDDDKTKLAKDVFYYLYDINCVWKSVDIDGMVDLEQSITDIILDRKFGKDIKELSDINVSMAFDVNEWLKRNDVSNVSVFNVSYEPIVDNMPCDSLSFTFKMNINDKREITIRLQKTDDNSYKVSFKENEWFYDITISDIGAFVQVVGETIKNYIA